MSKELVDRLNKNNNPVGGKVAATGVGARSLNSNYQLDKTRVRKTIGSYQRSALGSQVGTHIQKTDKAADNKANTPSKPNDTDKPGYRKGPEAFFGQPKPIRERYNPYG